MRGQTGGDRAWLDTHASPGNLTSMALVVHVARNFTSSHLARSVCKFVLIVPAPDSKLLPNVWIFVAALVVTFPVWSLVSVIAVTGTFTRTFSVESEGAETITRIVFTTA